MTDGTTTIASKTAEPSFMLWSDDPADVDLLSFSAISATVVDALLDDEQRS
jgi:hypothetical protein